MFTFEVKDMSCGHCVSTITQALKTADPDARVHIDLASHRVQIESTAADAEALAGAIRDAGYSPAPVSAAAAAAPAQAGGSCCGCR